MGREIKRVPLNFDWPVGEIWPGYMFSSLCGVMENYIKDDEKRCMQCKIFAKIMNIKIEFKCPNLDNDMEPPKGNGWQLWENVSEGSPCSPVFKTPELLARYLTDNPKASSLITGNLSYKDWLIFIKDIKYACSGVMNNGIMKSGVQAFVDSKKGGNK